MEHTQSVRQLNVSHDNRLTTPVVVSWILATILMGLGLMEDVGALKGAGAATGVGYTIALIWWFIRSQPHAVQLPDCTPILPWGKTYRTMLTAILLTTTAAFAVTAILLKNGWYMVLLNLLMACGLLIAWRSRIRRKLVFGMLAVGIVLFLIETFLSPGETSPLIMAIGIMPLFLAGTLLLEHTQLTRSQFLDGRYVDALKSFLWGCFLAVPPALMNVVLSEGEVSAFDQQFRHWWQAFYALQPGILEEVWARLFLTTLLYALLRPVSNTQPKRALGAAFFIATIIHGLAHYPESLANPVAAVFIALMYGIPLVLLYVKRDFEQAVAYHFWIDFVRFAIAVL